MRLEATTTGKQSEQIAQQNKIYIGSPTLLSRKVHTSDVTITEEKSEQVEQKNKVYRGKCNFLSREMYILHLIRVLGRFSYGRDLVYNTRTELIERSINGTAIRDLAIAFGDPSKLIRGAAASVLGEMAGSEALPAVPHLIKALVKDSEERVRLNATVSLGRIALETKEGMKHLIKALQCSNLSIKRAGASTVGHIITFNYTAVTIEPFIDIVPHLITVLQDSDLIVRRNAAVSLSQIASLKDAKEVLTVDTILQYIKDPDAQVRSSAVCILGMVGDLTVIPVLIEVLNTDEDVSVKIWAAQYLGNFGYKAAAASLDLIKFIESDADKMLRGVVAGAIVKIDEAGIIVPKLIELLQIKDRSVKREALSILGGMGPKAKLATSALIELLLSELDSTVQLDLLYALQQIYLDQVGMFTQILEEAGFSLSEELVSATYEPLFIGAIPYETMLTQHEAMLTSASSLPTSSACTTVNPGMLRQIAPQVAKQQEDMKSV